MGHLTKMANALSASRERGCNCEVIQKLWSELPEDCRQKWDAFVLGTLADINKKNTVEFVSAVKMFQLQMQVAGLVLNIF
jgi:hypothetical protein